MKNRIKLISKFILFLFILFSCVILVEKVLEPEYYYNDEWPTTATYQNFYKLEKDSVDVLFLGSSHCASAFNPQLLYDNYGITSYNLGCEQQSMVVSYYWLKEALKTQSPKAVVIDSYMLFMYESGEHEYNNLNCAEAAVRKAVDPMHLSMNKVNLARDIEEIDPSQSAKSFIFKNIRFHSRWYELGENDFTSLKMESHNAIKGFSPMSAKNPGADFEPFCDGETSEVEQMVPTMTSYFEKIVSLCKEENIELILTCIPAITDIYKYNATKSLADSLDVPYYDYNEAKIYNAIEYDVKEYSHGHPNIWGAEKITNYIGDILKNQYGIKPQTDISFDLSREEYERIKYNCELINITDPVEYLNKLKNENYVLFIYGRGGIAEIDDTNIYDLVEDLGTNFSLSQLFGDYYFGMVDEATKEYRNTTFGDTKFTDKGSFRDGLSRYEISNIIYANGYQKTSFKIDGIEAYSGEPGIHFIVYDKENKRTIDVKRLYRDEEGIKLSGML